MIDSAIELIKVAVIIFIISIIVAIVLHFTPLDPVEGEH
jgi:hypothetical protein